MVTFIISLSCTPVVDMQCDNEWIAAVGGGDGDTYKHSEHTCVRVHACVRVCTFILVHVHSDAVV